MLHHVCTYIIIAKLTSQTEAVTFRKLQVHVPESPTVISAPMTTYMDVFSMRMLFGPSYFPNDIDMNISSKPLLTIVIAIAHVMHWSMKNF